MYVEESSLPMHIKTPEECVAHGNNNHYGKEKFDGLPLFSGSVKYSSVWTQLCSDFRVHHQTMRSNGNVQHPLEVPRTPYIDGGKFDVYMVSYTL